MKKPLCPVCKKKPRRLYAGRWTVTCRTLKCHQRYYYDIYQAEAPKKKLKCVFCKKLFAVPKHGVRKRVTCGSEDCLYLSRVKFLKEWKKENPDLIREQKRRWKQRRREAVKKPKVS